MDVKLLFISTAQAQEGFDKGIGDIASKAPSLGISGDSLAEVLLSIINTVLFFGAIIALAAIVWGGITYIISLGNDTDIQKAKKIIMWAIIGLIIMGASFAIISTISTIFSTSDGPGGGIDPATGLPTGGTAPRDLPPAESL